jgi:hypothetical protein
VPAGSMAPVVEAYQTMRGVSVLAAAGGGAERGWPEAPRRRQILEATTNRTARYPRTENGRTIAVDTKFWYLWRQHPARQEHILFDR